MMNRDLTQRFALGLPMAACLAGLLSCQGTGRSGLHLGMSKEEVTAKFGPPIRIEKDSNGGQEWYYRTSLMEATVERESTPGPDFSDEWRLADGETIQTSSVTKTLKKKYRELPVSISPDGKVDGMPNGKLERTDR